jgi:ribosomal-protein-alanine N-acetyltransferase
LSVWTIVPMGQGDIEEVLEIEQSLFSAPWSRLSYESELAGTSAYNYIVKSEKETNGTRIVAYSCFHLAADEMHVLKIAVHRKWQQKGIASRLLRECLDMAIEKGATIAFLEVRVSNLSAIKFYSKFGFQHVGTRPGYYSENREDALVMIMKLKIGGVI